MGMGVFSLALSNGLFIDKILRNILLVRIDHMHPVNFEAYPVADLCFHEQKVNTSHDGFSTRMNILRPIGYFRLPSASILLLFHVYITRAAFGTSQAWHILYPQNLRCIVQPFLL